MSTLLFILIANTSFAAAFSGLKPVIQRIGAHMSSVSSLPSVPSTSSLSDINYGLSDEEFSSWLTNEVAVCPGRTIYSSVYDNAIEAIVEWRKRYRGNPLLWKRIFRKEKVIKELVEVAPVIDVVKSVVEAYDEDENFTIVDLCSGKGYMSMLLSEILPKDKVERIVLVDKAWAIANKETTKELKPHHMNWDHIYGTNPLTEKSYFCSWPIKLYTSKQDLKQSCNPRQLKKHLFSKATGPIIILAVHLCGTLSLKAVDMFNTNDNVKLFALKPCCLPRMVYAKRGDMFRIGGHEFDAKDVCSNGVFNKKNWDGPPRWHLEPKFDLWADNLFKGISIDDLSNNNAVVTTNNGQRILVLSGNGTKAKDKIKIQVDGGFQNTYIFAERQPITSAIWR